MWAADQGPHEDAVAPKVYGSHDFQDSHIDPEQDEATGDRYWYNWSIEQGVLDEGKSLVFSDFLSLLVIVDFIKLVDSLNYLEVFGCANIVVESLEFI